MKTIDFIAMMKAAAQEDHRSCGKFDGTGVSRLGAIRCHYYPVSNRHTFWLWGEVVSLTVMREFLKNKGLR